MHHEEFSRPRFPNVALVVLSRINVVETAIAKVFFASLLMRFPEELAHGASSWLKCTSGNIAYISTCKNIFPLGVV
jgi:hypothetical protein